MPAIKRTGEVVILCLFWCFFILELPVLAITPFDLPGARALSDQNVAPWTLTSDKIEHIKEEDVYKAEGHVVLQSGSRRIEADRAVFYKKEGLVRLYGNVLISYGEDWLRGEYVIWDLERQTGYIEHGKAYFPKNHFYVEAERIEKTGSNEYRLDRGFVTTCNPSSPDWSIGYKHLYLPSSGMAQARNVTFRVGSVPVIFVPWVMVPVNVQRQSGILQPIFGFSDLNGFLTEVPYYMVISQDQDATFFAQAMQKRGIMGGIEYRWNNARWGEGIFLTNYMRDLADADSVRAHGFSMSERDRFWIRGRALIDFPYNVEARLNLDMVSDRDFMSEFTRGSPSFQYTDTAFRTFLGTGLLIDKTRTARESNAYIFKKWEDTDLSLDLHYWDENDASLKDVTMQQLPSLSFDVGSSPLLRDIPLYYSVRSSVTQYWLEEGAMGTKILLSPEISLPKQIASTINTRTTFLLHNALYRTDKEISKETEDLTGRAVPYLETEANVRLEREYDVNFWNVASVVHNISPFVAYEYAPKVEEKNIPAFDESNSLFYTNRIRYGVQSFLMANRGNSSEEWARVKVFQYYRVGEQRVPFFEGGLPGPVGKDKGVSDVYADIELTPHRYIDLSYTMAASPDDGSVRQHDAVLSLHTFTGQSIGIEYRYRENTGVDEIIGSLAWDIRPWLSLATYHNYSFAKDEMFKQGYTVTYRRNCWSVSLSYEREGGDRRFFVSVNLLGLGQVAIK
ncbi:MAG: LPS-assembly protein LptD [Thermodesulforhabdaceae bacterium]